MNPYERVRLSRSLTNATFPLPAPLDCVRYAITELAEMDDALLRMERAGDKRNNTRNTDPRAEMGQCGYMLLSALVQLPGAGPKAIEDRVLAISSARTTYFTLLGDLAAVGQEMERGVEDGSGGTLRRAATLLGIAWRNFSRLACLHGWSVDDLIEDACAAFEARHATKEAA